MTIIRHDFHQQPKTVTTAGQRKKPIPGFQLRIDLSYSSPLIWRTVNIPGTLTLAGFHSVIQACFGWRDEASHRFLVGKIFYSPDEVATTGGSRSSSATQLHALEKDMGFIFSYLYDGGCGWECEITLEQLLADARDLPHPVLLAAEGACPPATFDDIHAYQELLAHLEKTGTNHQEILAEQGIAGPFNPSYCDMASINEQLKLLS